MAAMSVPGAWYLVLAAVLFGLGATGLLVRRNVLVMFMCVELMLNAVNLTFVTFARLHNDIGGQVIRVLRAGRGGRRGGGRPGHHRGHVPAPRRGDGRRHPLAEGLTSRRERRLRHPRAPAGGVADPAVRRAAHRRPAVGLARHRHGRRARSWPPSWSGPPCSAGRRPTGRSTRTSSPGSRSAPST